MVSKFETHGFKFSTVTFHIVIGYVSRNTLYANLLCEHHWQYTPCRAYHDGLNKNKSSIGYIWPQVSGAVWGCCGILKRGSLDEGSTLLGWALIVHILILLPVCSLCFVFRMEDVSPQLPASHLLLYLAIVIGSTSGNMNQSELSFITCFCLWCFNHNNKSNCTEAIAYTLTLHCLCVMV